MREDVVLKMGKAAIVDLRFDLSQTERIRLLTMSLIWIAPLAFFVWYALEGMEYDLSNYRELLTPLYAVLFLMLCVPPFWMFTPEHIKGAPLHLFAGWVLRMTKEGLEWRYNLFDPVQFYWNEVEIVAIQRKGWSKSPYFVIYTKRSHDPVFTWPHYKRELQQIKGRFGEKAAAAIELSRLSVKEDFFREMLEQMMTGSGFQIIREGKDTFYKKLDQTPGAGSSGRTSFSRN